MTKIFGTDGIRGLANIHPMDVETAVTAGRALAVFLNSREVLRNRILIGQDTRISGDMLAQAVGAGICSAGMDVAFLGVMPTPAVAYLTHAMGAAAGVVISASHNPFDDNGIKLFNSNGYKLSDEEEADIEALMSEKGKTEAEKTPSRGIGAIHAADLGLEDYLDFLQGAVPDLDLTGLNIVLDCSNGATHRAAPELFRRLGARTIPIFCDPDGVNINQGCGSQHPEKMAEAVVREKADLGLAFDGDGDRLIAVDETGAVLSGDQIMAVCANHLITNGKLESRVVVSTVMSNMGFHQAMKQLGAEVKATQVGDRYVMQEMRNANAVLGGEDSGHIIFTDVHTTGDGIMAAVRLLDAVVSSKNGSSLSQLSAVMEVFPQVLINVEVADKPDISRIPEIVAAIEAAERALGDQGRVLVRYSGTQSMCRVMVEGPTQQETEAHCQRIAEVVKARLN